MNTRKLVMAATMAVALAACGGSAGSAPSTAEATAATAATQGEAQPATGTETASGAQTVAETPTTIDVKSGDSDLGDVLTSPDGLTLYAFTNDVDATSTCYGTCADAWPPVVVDVDWTAGPGLDFGIFATTVREDGTLQLVAGKWPLYTFAGDAAPGDVNGQGSGDVWFAVDTDGLIIEGAGSGAADTAEADTAEAGAADVPAEAAPAAVATTSLGDTLVDADGLTLYGFLNDSEGMPTCNDACADAWPPVVLAGAELPAGLDADVFSVVERSDGTFQLKAGNWPLYRFAGDAIAGDVNGQGSGDVWFAASPDGSLIDAAAVAESTDSNY